MTIQQTAQPWYSFKNDYSEGAHPRILEVLAGTNLLQEDGYGEDASCLRAADLIRGKIGSPEADVHFIPGGTQANLVVIASILRPHESVISADSGHIHVHETGAVEATGHKINVVASADGKLTTGGVEAVLREHYFEHMVKPALVYISNSTEVGTFYTKGELEALSACCRENGLYLYADGARLGSALCAEGGDLTLEDMARLTDVFYIGGTKNGALLGEAIVITRPELKADFRYILKQRGALLAKGRILGAQFEALFRDDLYFDLARHANRMAAKLTAGIKAAGYGFLTESGTNQIFPILPKSLIARLEKTYGFYVWCGVDGSHDAIRLVTSWATREEKVDAFLKDLKGI